MADLLFYVGAVCLGISALSLLALRIIWGIVIHSPRRRVRSDSVPIAVFLVLVVSMCLSVLAMVASVLVSLS